MMLGIAGVCLMFKQIQKCNKEGLSLRDIRTSERGWTSEHILMEISLTLRHGVPVFSHKDLMIY